jgi:hypothetical protein
MSKAVDTSPRVQDSVVKYSLTTAPVGKSDANRFRNLNAIISITYRKKTP